MYVGRDKSAVDIKNWSHDKLDDNQRTFHRYGLVRQPYDYQYEVPFQPRKPLTLENRHNEDDLINVYNPNKRPEPNPNAITQRDTYGKLWHKTGEGSGNLAQVSADPLGLGINYEPAAPVPGAQLPYSNHAKSWYRGEWLAQTDADPLNLGINYEPATPAPGALLPYSNHAKNWNSGLAQVETAAAPPPPTAADITFTPAAPMPGA